MQKTEELFNIWNDEKQKIDFSKKINRKRVNIGEIWICKIGVNIGSEISKDEKFQRPVLIISNFLGGDLVAILPMSTKFNEKYKEFYLEIENFENYGLNQKTYLLLNHFKTISTKRLVKRINNITISTGHIPCVPHLEMLQIKKLIQKMYKL
ncbi:MAG: type II toxin-antitoxin system PemK/MazF family toxin [Candidatus Gracilibacteria bacterium]